KLIASRTAAAVAAANGPKPPRDGSGRGVTKSRRAAANTRARNSAGGPGCGRSVNSRSRPSSSGGSGSGVMAGPSEGGAEFFQGITVTAGGSVRADAQAGRDLREGQAAVHLQGDHLALVRGQFRQRPLQSHGPVEVGR